MTINFPPSPSFGDQFSVDTKTWEWNGVLWKTVSGLSGTGRSSLEPSLDEYYDFASVYGADQGYDYEFNNTTTSIPTGWAWINQGTSTYEEGFGCGVINPQQAGGTYDWRMLVQGLPPGSNWTIWAHVLGDSLTTQYSPGLVFRKSGTGQFSQVMVDYSTSSQDWYLAEWTDETTYSANILNGVVRGPQIRYIKVECISGYIDMYFSSDGAGWIKPITTYSPFGTTSVFDQVGFGCTNTQPGEDTYVGLRWLRIRT